MKDLTDDLKFFEKFLYEAPEDDPPDSPPTDEGSEDAPPDLPEDNGGDAPPDLDDSVPGDVGDDLGSDAPPDIGDNFSDDDMGDNPGGGQDDPGNPSKPPQELDAKVSAVLNKQLYQQFLSMLDRINSQISIIKNNTDALNILAPDSVTKTLNALRRLGENVNIYLNDNFVRENYSKNKLFYNMCLNLLKLLSDGFGQEVSKGVKSVP